MEKISSEDWRIIQLVEDGIELEALADMAVELGSGVTDKAAGNDRAGLARVVSGHLRKAYSRMELDRTSLDKLYRYAYTLTANQADAYDLLHNAIETSLNRPSETTEKNIAYMRVIMRNRFIDEYRHNQSFPHEDIADHSPVSMSESSLEDVVIASHDLAVLWKTLEPVIERYFFSGQLRVLV